MQSTVNLPSTVVGKAPILVGNVMPQECEIEQDSYKKAESRDKPYDKRKEHAKENDDLLPIVICQDLDVDEKLDDLTMAVTSFVFPGWYQICLHYRVKGESIDELSWALCEYDA